MVWSGALQTINGVFFWRRAGFAVLDGAHSPEEIRFLNDFCDSTQERHPRAWGLHQARATSVVWTTQFEGP